MNKFALFALVFVLGGCTVMPAAQPAYDTSVVPAPSIWYIQPAPLYYSPIVPYYWGPPVYFNYGWGWRGHHR